MQHYSALRAIAFFLAMWTAALLNQARATVIWSFFETGISCVTGVCTLPPQPFVFATLTVPGPISSGTAVWRGVGTPPPIYTGDEFIFAVDIFRLTPAFNGNQAGACGVGGGRLTICDFDISWSATTSSLAISIIFDAINDSVGLPIGRPFGSSGGPIATDFILGGCENTQCVLTGFWQSGLVLPEPSSASLIVGALLGVWFRRRLRPSKTSPARALAARCKAKDLSFRR